MSFQVSSMTSTTDLTGRAADRSDVLQAWQHLVKGIARQPSLDLQCRFICRELAESFGFTRAMIATVDSDRRQLVTLAAHDPTITKPLYTVLSKLFSTSLEPDPDGRLNTSAWCVVKQEQVYVADASRYDFRPDVTYQRTLVVKALGGEEYVLTPIVWHRESIGMLAADKKGTSEGISTSDRDTLQSVADLIALVLKGTPEPPLQAPSDPLEDQTLEVAAAVHFDQAWQMQSLLDALHEGLLVLSPDGTVRYLNHAACSLLQVIAWEAIGLPWTDVLPIVDRVGFKRMLDEHGSTGWSPPKRWKLRRGDREIELKIDIVHVPSDRLEGTRALVIEDVSHQAVVERMRNEFTSMLVHDLKAPLQSIVGFAELLRTQRLGELNDDQKRFVALIESSGEHMMQLAGDILEVAQFELGGSLMHKKAVRAHEIIGTVLNRMQGKAMNACVEIRNEVASDLPLLYGDPTRLAETFQNLLDNAINASSPGGRMWLRAVSRTCDGEAYVQFEVVDEGKGIDPAVIPHLFEKFRVRKKVEEGSGASHGFGLVIARLIVEGHRGQIWAESEAGRGTIIRLTLPIYRNRE